MQSHFKNKNQKSDEERQQKDSLSQEIFGDEVVSTEKNEAELSDDSTVDNISPDQNFESEAMSGYRHSKKKSQNIAGVSPGISGGDVDADWLDEAETEGDETSLAENTTPDQNQISANAAPWGLDYSETEQINTLKKIKELEKSSDEDSEDELLKKGEE